jgi:glycosyltransferase involved in cell wall biosynthesis
VLGVEIVPIPVEQGVEKALVMTGSSSQPSPSPALARAFDLLFAELRRRGADAVSQHAFDVEAIELAEGLPVLHTLHLPPISRPVLAAVLGSRSAFATVSASCAASWAAEGVHGLAVLRNGIPSFPVLEVEIRPTALLAGRLSPEKGFEDGVEAARRAGLHPVVVGIPYDPTYAPSLGEATLLPPQLRSGLWALMAGAAVTLQPVHWDEPFGMIAAEAQMAGCPVAGYARGGLVETVADGVSGFLAEPDNVTALAAAARASLTLDRATVRKSALQRLSLNASLDAYETALAAVAG